MKKPKECCCCGSNAGSWKQWWNRDAGYGLCEKCIDFCARGFSKEYFVECYGRAGEHYAREPMTVVSD